MIIISIIIGALWTIHKDLAKGLEDLEIRGQVETILDNSIIEIGQKSRGDLRRLAVTKTLMWKISKGAK